MGRKKSDQLLLLLILIVLRELTLTSSVDPPQSENLASPPLAFPTSQLDLQVMHAFANSIHPAPIGWSSTTDPCDQDYKWKGVTCEFGRIIFINLRSMSLNGTLPPDINRLDSLRSLSLQDNSFVGPLPSFENLGNLQEFYVNQNNFTKIPDRFFNGLTNLINVSLDVNDFEAWEIPLDLAGSESLQSFTASRAGISGHIPDFFGKMMSLQTLRLSYNNLIGSIPLSFIGSGIKELYLNNQNTELSGGIEVLGNMPQLTTVMLQSNNFTGQIPDMSNCTLLSILELRDNRLTGPVPKSFFDMESLTKVTLTNNLLQGPFPSIKSDILNDDDNTGNSYCNDKPGPCDPIVNRLIEVAEGFGYPIVIADSWVGNDPCVKWAFVTCHGENVSILNFGNKNFGGVISPGFAEITTLKRIILNRNQLTGSIPDELTKLPDLQLLDVSGNNLSGKIPIFRSDVEFIYADNPFLGTDINPPPSSAPSSSVSPARDESHFGVVWIILPSVAFAVVILIAFLLAYRLMERKKTSITPISMQSLENPVERIPTPSHPSHHTNVDVVEADGLVLSIQSLRLATSHFSTANILGKGGFGVVYRGQLPDGTLIAVKRMECSEVGKKKKKISEFSAEISVMTTMKHRHLVALLGYCVEDDETILVYEYMSQGTLRDHLHANSDNERQYPALNWKQRLVIALDVARGMEYLHTLANRSFIHRDLKPSNILLDDNMRAKVSDFGLAKLIPDGKHSFHTRIAGTFGYLAPDYAGEQLIIQSFLL